MSEISNQTPESAVDGDALGGLIEKVQPAENKNGLFYLVFIGLIAFTCFLGYKEMIGRAMPSTEIDLAKLGTNLGWLAFVAVFIERAVEVFLSGLRGGDADQLDLDLQNRRQAIAALEADASKTKELAFARQQLRLAIKNRNIFRSQSRRIAFLVALLFGLLAALVGVRGLQPLLVNQSLPSVTYEQQKSCVDASGAIEPVDCLHKLFSPKPIEFSNYFTLIDILLTAALLAGGADGISKVTKIYSSYLTKVNSNLGQPAKPGP